MLMGKLLILLGAVLLTVGLLITYLPGLPWGRLPGDFSLHRGNFRFYFPLATLPPSEFVDLIIPLAPLQIPPMVTLPLQDQPVSFRDSMAYCPL